MTCPAARGANLVSLWAPALACDLAESTMSAVCLCPLLSSPLVLKPLRGSPVTPEGETGRFRQWRGSSGVELLLLLVFLIQRIWNFSPKSSLRPKFSEGSNPDVGCNRR